MGVLRRIDDALIRLCARIAHAVQIWTGKTNFFIAKVGLIIAALPVILGIMNYFARILYDPTPKWRLVMFIIVLLSGIDLMLMVDKADKREPSEVRVIVQGLRLLSWRGFRIYALVCLFFNSFTVNPSFLDFLGGPLVFQYGVLVFVYFIAVDPLPPRKSKIREWVEGFSFGDLAPVRVGSNG